jgi:hypothetical protein
VHRYVWAPPASLATVEHNDKPITDTKEMTVVDQLTQLASDHHRQRLAHAEAQRPAERLLALARATRRADRAGRRMRRADRQARRLLTQLEA